MPRFRDIRGGGIHPPMSYVEFERPCRLGLNGCLELIILENFILKNFSFLQISGGGKWGG